MGGYISKSKKPEHDTVIYDYNNVAEGIKPYIIKILRISINRMLAINQYFLQFVLNEQNMYHIGFVSEQDNGKRCLNHFFIPLNILFSVVYKQLNGEYFTIGATTTSNNNYVLTVNIVKYSGDGEQGKIEVITQDIDEILYEISKMDEIKNDEEKKNE